MLIKAGVDISRLRPEIRKILTTIERTINAVLGEELIITSTYEGNHLPGSMHYAHLAIDIRARRNIATLKNEIARTLGSEYFVYQAKTHIHIGHNPKR